MRSFFDFDSKLRGLKNIKGEPHQFKRFQSLSALPFEWSHIQSNLDKKLIEHYRSLITRTLVSKFARPALQRAEHGMLINVDEALDGIPECFRRTRNSLPVLKLGLNLSGDYGASDKLFALRCAAILAIYQLAASRGQKVQFDVCYGWCGDFVHLRDTQGHVRVMIANPNEQIIQKLTSTSEMRNLFIEHLGTPYSGGYQLWHIEKAYGLKGEFDFVLDRIDTSDENIELERIMKQIEHLR